MMKNTKRFGTVSSWQEYQMLCRAERHLKQKKKPTGQRREIASDDDLKELRKMIDEKLNSN